MDLGIELTRFTKWAEGIPRDASGWEVAYPNWISLHAAVEATLALEALDPNQDQQILDALARDNDAEFVLDLLVDTPAHRTRIAEAGAKHDDFEARWQIAAMLGRCTDKRSAELLKTLVEDEHEYVRRRALVSLKDRDPRFAESVATDWIGSPHDYARLAAVHVLHDLNSKHLQIALDRLENDPFEHVRGKVAKLRGSSEDEQREQSAQ